MKEVWIVKGHVTNPDAYRSTASPQFGDVEWQFSDGPGGERGMSADFLSLEEGIKAHAGYVIYWDESNKDWPFVKA